MNSELLALVSNQKVLEKELGLSRSQAWRVFNSKSELSCSQIELLLLKLDAHAQYTLVTKGA